MKSKKYPYLITQAQQCIVFMAIPKSREGGSLTEIDQNRLQAVTRRVVADILIRTVLGTDSYALRKNLLMRQSRIVDTCGGPDISTTCGIVCMEVAKSESQIFQFEPCGEGLSDNPEHFAALEEFIKGCFSTGSIAEGSLAMFTWIPVKMRTEERGTLTDGIYSYPVHSFLKEVFPDASKGMDFIKLMRLCYADDPHAIVVYPDTERVALMTEFTTERLSY